MFPAPAASAEETEGAEEPRLELRDAKKEPALIAGYTTKDDSADGDDTMYEPIKFYNQPNCVQTEIAFPEEGDPETVDFVFLDFIQPWIIPALKFAGADYSDGDVEEYMEGTFTYKMAQWISENWKGNC